MTFGENSRRTTWKMGSAFLSPPIWRSRRDKPIRTAGIDVRLAEGSASALGVRPSLEQRRRNDMNDPQPVSFITVEDGDPITIAFAVPFEQPDEVVSLLLRRSWSEPDRPLRERGLLVSHALFPSFRPELASRVVVEGDRIEIESTARTYVLDVSTVKPEELACARETLGRMHWGRPFELILR